MYSFGKNHEKTWQQKKTPVKKRKTELTITAGRIKVVVDSTVKKYNLLELSEIVSRGDYASLSEAQREDFVLGFVELGEALTFARYNNELNPSFSNRSTHGELSSISYDFSNFRNYLVHHFLYENNINDQNKKISGHLEKLGSIGYMVSKLRAVRDNLELRKGSAQGKNDFDFNYEHQISTLDKELELVEKLLQAEKTSEEGKVIVTPALQNHVRNCLCVILDFTGENNKYRKEGFSNYLPENLKKNKVKEIIEELKNEQDQDLGVVLLLNDVKEKRNNLSHFLNEQSQITVNEIPEIAAGLIKLKELGFINKIRESLSQMKVDNSIPKTSIVSNMSMWSQQHTRRSTKKKSPFSSLVKKSTVKTSNVEPETEKNEVKSEPKNVSDGFNPLALLAATYSEAPQPENESDKNSASINDKSNKSDEGVKNPTGPRLGGGG